MRISRVISIATLSALAACSQGARDIAEDEAGRGDNSDYQAREDANGTITYTTEDGEATITTQGNASTAAGGLPPYTGADNSRGVSINATGRDGGSGQISSFQTSDTPEQVIAFYRRALESQGYEITATMNMGQSQTMTANRGSGDTGIHISATSAGGRATTVSVIAGGR
jgi:hypothetical protein